MRRVICPEGQIDIFPGEVMAELFRHPRPDAPLPPLPFPRNQEIDVPRITKILATHTSTVLRMLNDKVIKGGYQVREGKGAPWRVPYAGVLDYCDDLRLKYHLAPRPASSRSGRIPDSKLLPFPMVETMTVAEVVSHLDVPPRLVGHMLQEGELMGYRLLDGAPWRIWRNSYRDYLTRLHKQAKPPLSSSAP